MLASRLQVGGGSRRKPLVDGAIGSLQGEEDIAHYCRRGDEGNDAHLASTIGATEREHFVDAGQQHGPRVASGAASGRLVGGRCLEGSGATAASGTAGTARAVTAARRGEFGASTLK